MVVKGVVDGTGVVDWDADVVDVLLLLLLLCRKCWVCRHPWC